MCSYFSLFLSFFPSFPSFFSFIFSLFFWSWSWLVRPNNTQPSYIQRRESRAKTISRLWKMPWSIRGSRSRWSCEWYERDDRSAYRWNQGEKEEALVKKRNGGKKNNKKRRRVVNVSLGKIPWTRRDIGAHFRRVAREHELLEFEERLVLAHRRFL